MARSFRSPCASAIASDAATAKEEGWSGTPYTSQARLLPMHHHDDKMVETVNTCVMGSVGRGNLLTNDLWSSI